MIPRGGVVASACVASEAPCGSDADILVEATQVDGISHADVSLPMRWIAESFGALLGRACARFFQFHFVLCLAFGCGVIGSDSFERVFGGVEF